jgi:peptidoglycan/LPS O-acetylase OafA/YrhL
MFFVLSGFLIPFVIVASVRKSSNDKLLTFREFLIFMIKRCFRICPSIWSAMCIIMLYGYLTTDALANMYLYTEECKSYWWANFIFVENIVNRCIRDYWSVSVEMQLYLLSAIPVALYLRNKLYGFCAVSVMILFPICFRIILTSTTMTDTSYNMYIKYIYANTFARADAYGFGMAAFFLWDSRDSKQLSLILNNPWFHGVFTATQVLSIVTSGFFLTYDSPSWWHLSQNSYQNTAYIVFAAATTSVILLGLTDTVPAIKWILGSSWWTPLASVSYTSYLLQELAIRVFAYYCIVSGVIDPDTFNVTYWKYLLMTLGSLLLCLLMGLLLSLFIERPLMSIGSQLFQRKKRHIIIDMVTDDATDNRSFRRTFY